MAKQTTLGIGEMKQAAKAVECLGMSFESDAARRAHFTEILRQKLADPAFRATPGFPKATDEAILRMSDPTYYTACPNPFVADFLARSQVRTSSDELPVAYTGDIAEPKDEPEYRLPSYYTKVPPAAIASLIEHYTRPGDTVFDPFCGSGMTAVAALRVGRRAIVSDLSPLAALIAHHSSNLAKTAVVREFADLRREASLLSRRFYVDAAGKEYEYAIWSEQFVCDECGHVGDLFDFLVDIDGAAIRNEFSCPSCDSVIRTRSMKRHLATEFDALIGKPLKTERIVCKLLSYSEGRRVNRRPPTPADLQAMSAAVSRASSRTPPELPFLHLTHERNNLPENWGITHLHHFYTPRNWAAISEWLDAGSGSFASRLFLLSCFHENSGTKRNRFYVDERRRNGSPIGPLSNTLYVPSLQVEANIGQKLLSVISQAEGVFGQAADRDWAMVGTQSALAAYNLLDNSIDFVFTDPPFGRNINYSEQSFLLEWWAGVLSNTMDEAIINTVQRKGVSEYRDLMARAFAECFRVLRPGRWLVVEFSNSSNEVWHAIQHAIQSAGFVIASVGVLDKKAYTLHQDHKAGTVNRDLIISAYKPISGSIKGTALGSASEADVWGFVREHLRSVPVFLKRGGDIEVVLERTAASLFDRMIAFFVQRRVAVPLSASEFFSGVADRFPSRDGMLFLPEQASAYDRRRAAGGEVVQLSLFVADEASAIRWLRQVLERKPQSFQELQPQYMKAAATWAKHERTLELRDLLKENFLHYDGNGDVPAPVHSYLSTNLKLRNLGKDHPELRAAGRDRWYVPSVHRQGDLEQLRIRALLREFEEYKSSTQRKIKQFRTEAVRAGFKAAYDARDYRTIVEVAAKLPDEVVQEDEKLLMYLDVAMMRYDAEQPPTLFPER